MQLLKDNVFCTFAAGIVVFAIALALIFALDALMSSFRFHDQRS